MEIVDSVVVVLIPGATPWKAHVPIFTKLNLKSGTEILVVNAPNNHRRGTNVSSTETPVGTLSAKLDMRRCGWWPSTKIGRRCGSARPSTSSRSLVNRRGPRPVPARSALRQNDAQPLDRRDVLQQASPASGRPSCRTFGARMLRRSACSSQANVTAATSPWSSNGKATRLIFRRAHVGARFASSTVASGHPTQNQDSPSRFVILRSCRSTPSDLGRPRFTYARAAALRRWLPAKSRIIFMRSSTSMCWRIWTNRGCTELPPTSKAKMLNPVFRAEGAIGSPMFALPKGTEGAHV